MIMAGYYSLTFLFFVPHLIEEKQRDTVFGFPWCVIFYHFFRIFNLDIFWVLILQKRIGSWYLVPVTPTTVLSRSFWNFTGALRMVWRYACVFFRILKLFIITGFLLQYLGKWYRTNGPLVNLPIFNSSNKNKAGDINSLWNLLVLFWFFFPRIHSALKQCCIHVDNLKRKWGYCDFCLSICLLCCAISAMALLI